MLRHGDPREREFWPALQKHFPLYEDFWRLHVFPLRGADGHIRGDIDERLEIMAQEHYKTFVSLHKVLNGLGDASHPEQTFSSMQNAANSAKRVLMNFNSIRAECMPANSAPIDAEPFADFCRTIARYRNQVHEDLVPMVERQNRRYLPKPDKLDQYSRWSRLKKPDLSDFIPVSDVLNERFESLCNLLDHHWRKVLDRSPGVLGSPRYAQLLPSLPEGLVPVMNRIELSSNVQRG